MEALEATFTDTYPNELFRAVTIGIEFPVEQSSYPNLWVNYEDTDELSIAGINHKEFAETSPGHVKEVTRWKYAGTITITVAALTSLERDGLYDEVVRVFAFGRENENLRHFRDLIETNDFIGMNIDFDHLQPTGDNEGQGTPWGTDEMIYEKSLAMDVIGEFVGDPSTGDLVLLSRIITEITPLATPITPAPPSPVGNNGWM